MTHSLAPYSQSAAAAGAAGPAVAGALLDLLAPLSPEEFFRSTWGRTMLHQRGAAGRFDGLVSWATINRVLAEHRPTEDRVSLIHRSAPVEQSAYAQGLGFARTALSLPELMLPELYALLRDGATLYLHRLDEVHEPLRALAEAIERTTGARTIVEAFVSFGSEPTAVHWDPGEAFILQIAGRKRWEVFGETTPNPIARAGESLGARPDTPIRDEVLEPGDLLYLPRGWWHRVSGLGEPSLHLAIGVANRNGMDMVTALAERLRASAAFRRDLPHFADDAERDAHMRRLREELMAEWDALHVSAYLEESTAVIRPRPRLSLPWVGVGDGLPPSDDHRLRAFTPWPTALAAAPGEGLLELKVNGRHWRFAPQAEPVLRPLLDGEACTIGELCARAAGVLDRATVREFLGGLVVDGLLCVEEPAA